jgi:HSP20 family protein
VLRATFDPFTEFDRIVERAFGWTPAVAQSVIPMDGVRRENDLVLRFDLPGIDPESIDVTVERGVLTVAARRTIEHAEGETPFVRERLTGSFTRRLRLGQLADAEKVEADYSDGVLTVRVPLAEQAKPRKVEIRTETRKPITA